MLILLLWFSELGEIKHKFNQNRQRKAKKRAEVTDRPAGTPVSLAADGFYLTDLSVCPLST